MGEGILDQVSKDLLEGGLCRLEGGHLSRAVDGKSWRNRKILNDFIDKMSRIDRLDAGLFASDARVVEKACQKTLEAIGPVLEQGEIFKNFGRGDAPNIFLDPIRQIPDPPKRRFQIMGGDIGKAVELAVASLEILNHGLLGFVGLLKFFRKEVEVSCQVPDLVVGGDGDSFVQVSLGDGCTSDI